MSRFNILEGTPLGNIKLGKKTSIIVKIFIWLELFVIALYLFNIIFSLLIIERFPGVGFFLFHNETWKVLMGTNTFSSMIVLTIPIAITAMGATFNERVGNINIGLEGVMLWGAFASTYYSYLFESAWLGVFSAVAFGIFFGLVHAVFTITFKGEQIVTGVAINLMALGLTNALTVLVWTTHTSPKVESIDNYNLFDLFLIGPILEFLSFSEYENLPEFLTYIPDPIAALNNQNMLIYIGILLIPILHILLFKTTIGLRFRVIGEHPQTAATAGINVIKYQYAAVILSGALAGFAGSLLTIGSTSQFIQNTTAGKGFIALAAMIFGKWTILGSVLGAVIFGYFFSLQVRLGVILENVFDNALGRGSYFNVPPPVIQMIPYVVTILALTGFIGRAKPPSHIGKPYDPTQD